MKDKRSKRWPILSRLSEISVIIIHVQKEIEKIVQLSEGRIYKDRKMKRTNYFSEFLWRADMLMAHCNGRLSICFSNER